MPVKWKLLQALWSFERKKTNKKNINGLKTEALTEFHKDILSRIEGNLFEVLSHQNFDRVFVPVFRDVLAHEMGLKKNTQTNQGINRIKNSLK